MLNLLLVEDDIDLATAIIDYLTLENIQCDHAANGVVALNLIETHQYHVIILDINLPRMNGLAVCQSIRSQGIGTPVIMLTAKDSLDDKLEGFSSGADDYLVKPFDMEELIARVQALSRRKSGQATKLIAGNLELELDKKQAHVAGKKLQLTPTALIILEVLLRASPNPVSRSIIVREVWGDEPPESNNLKVHVFKLRKQLEIYAADTDLKTIKGFGFALVAN